jgi:hypothetical protein
MRLRAYSTYVKHIDEITANLGLLRIATSTNYRYETAGLFRTRYLYESNTTDNTGTNNTNNTGANRIRRRNNRRNQSILN